MAGNTSPVIRLFSIEFKKVFKGLSFYFIALVLVAMASLIITSMTSGYSSRVKSMEYSVDFRINMMIEYGISYLPGSVELPEGFNPDDYPLTDVNGSQIPENVQIYRELIENSIQQDIAKLTAKGGDFSFSSLIYRVIDPSFLWLLVLMPLVMGTLVFGGDYPNGAYRLMISLGVKRRNIISAKIMTATALSILLTLLVVAALFLTAWIAYQSYHTANPASIPLDVSLKILGVFAMISLAYTMLGGFIATLISSPVFALAVGIFIGILSFIFFNITPSDDFFLGKVSPFTLGYNFNSLIHNELTNPDSTGSYTKGVVLSSGGDKPVTITGTEATPDETKSPYRSTGLAASLVIVYTAAFSGFNYVIFNRKELGG